MNEVEQLRKNIEESSLQTLLTVKNYIDFEILKRTWWIFGILIVGLLVLGLVVSRKG